MPSKMRGPRFLESSSDIRQCSYLLSGGVSSIMNSINIYFILKFFIYKKHDNCFAEKNNVNCKISVSLFQQKINTAQMSFHHLIISFTSDQASTKLQINPEPMQPGTVCPRTEVYKHLRKASHCTSKINGYQHFSRRRV